MAPREAGVREPNDTREDAGAEVATAVGGEAITREAMAAALQHAWNDYCDDTGCHPDCFDIKGGQLFADFDRGNFAESVLSWLDAGTRDRVQAPSGSGVGALRQAIIMVLGENHDPFHQTDVERAARRRAGHTADDLPVGEVVEGLITGGHVRRCTTDTNLLELTDSGRDRFAALGGD